jgi:hypothetical protein
MFEAKEIISQNNDWISFIFLGVLVLLTFIRIRYNDRILHTTTLFFQKKYLFIYFNKEKNSVFNGFQTPFFLIKTMTISLLLYHINIFFNINSSLIWLKGYGIILICVSIYFLIHYLIGLLISEALSFQKPYKKVVFDKLNYFNNVILWILPLVVIYTYTDSYKVFFFNFLFLFSIVLLVLRYGLLLVNNKNLIFNNIFYFILYLCALEIAPFVIIFKLTN